jgi:monothiol glutaredoxin
MFYRMQQDIFNKIDQIIKTNNVVLFMKGTKNMPMCGFSVLVVSVLKKLDIDFKDVNVLEDNEIREGVKTYADWPTIPQLYIKGEFIGGCDIVKELYKNGELEKLVENN